MHTNISQCQSLLAPLKGTERLSHGVIVFGVRTREGWGDWGRSPPIGGVWGHIRPTGPCFAKKNKQYNVLFQTAFAMEQEEQPSFRRHVEDRRYYEVPARFALHTAYMEVS